MLVLSRKPGEKVVIGNGITVTVVTVVEVKGKYVRLGIDAPAQVRILRTELGDWRDAPAGSAEPAESALVYEGKMFDRQS
jgi:carbon storage regulator